MFTVKNTSIYFLIFLILIGINLFKNIYIENKVSTQLYEKGMKQVSSITCNGFFNIDCQLKNVSFSRNITNTTYTIEVREVHLLDVNILKNSKELNDFSLVLKNMKINDSRATFLELKKLMDLNITLVKRNTSSHIDMNLVREDLKVTANLILDANETLIVQKVSNIDIKISRDNDVIKKIIYELYKVKLLEIMESDDAEFSTTRGMNIPLGIDSKKVIPQDVFLGEPYESVSILLISEIETFDWVTKHNKQNNISTFISRVINKNGVDKLQIKKEN